MLKGRWPVNYIGISQGLHFGKCVDCGWSSDYGGKNVPIYASHDGIVKPLEVQPAGGNVVYIEHEDKTVSIYAHLSKFSVVEGQKVKMGEQIGNMGDTGTPTGSHLHYGIANNYSERYRYTEIDPFKVLEVYPDQEIGSGTLERYGDKFIYWTEKEEYETGTYITLSTMNVRKGAGTNYDRVLVKEMTKDGQKNAVSTEPNDYGVYKEGTKFTVLEIVKNEDGSIWGRGLSGYVCLVGSTGTVLCEKIK